MIILDGVSYFYSPLKPILKGISLHVSPGETVALVGVSGSGKTTLFRLMAGLIHPRSGKIQINGLPLPGGARQITYMQQNDLLLPWRTTWGNLLLPSELGAKRKKTPPEKMKEILSKVGLEGFERVYPNALSGGMRQRLALARALLQDKPVLLLDEAFGSLDVVVREQLYILLKQIQLEYRKTLILITHDFHDAFALATRILVLSQGRIADDIRVSTLSQDQILSQIRKILQSEYQATL